MAPYFREPWTGPWCAFPESVRRHKLSGARVKRTAQRAMLARGRGYGYRRTCGRYSRQRVSVVAVPAERRWQARLNATHIPSA